MAEKGKSRRAFIADLLFLGGGVTAVALVSKFRATVDEPEPLTPADDIADGETQAQTPPPNTPPADAGLGSDSYKVIRLARPVKKQTRSPYPGDYDGISGLLDR